MNDNVAPYFTRDESENLSMLYWAIATRQVFGARSAVEVFNTSVSLKSLIERPDLRLVSELDGEKRWGMHRIIQRNITQKRVSDIRGDFLKSRNKDVKYFPGITVALLPFDSQGPCEGYQAGEGFKGVAGFSVFVPGTDRETDEDSESWQGWNFPYQVRWDREKISAVVIDGQHRVKALREAYPSGSVPDLSGESIPASLVLLRDADAVRATRQIFIDVNNTPKTVSEQRLIFIDDRHIARRLTSRSVGASVLVGENVDPYVKFRELNYIDPGLLLDKINNLYVAGQTSDDSSEHSLYFSHEGLFPWEITHILTLHEYINKKILLSDPEKDREIGTGPDFSVLAFHVNNAEAKNIQKIAASSENPAGELQLQKQTIMQNDRISDAAKEILFHLINIHSQYAIPGDDADDDANNAVEFALREALRAPENFNLDSDHTESLLCNELNEVSMFSAHLMVHLDAYEEINKAVSDDSYVEKTHKFRLIETLRERRINIRREYCNAPALLVQEFVDAEEDEEYSNELQRGLSAWLESLIKINEKTGLLRYLVVQQGVFLWAVRTAGAAREQPFNKSLAVLAAQRINELRAVGFFQREGHVCLSGIFSDEVYLSCLEGTVLNASKIKTGRLNAMRLADLLVFLDKGVRSKDDAENVVPPTGFKAPSAFRKLKRSLGRAVLDILSGKEYSLGDVHSEIIRFSGRLELTVREYTEFREDWDNQTEVRQKELIQRALGAISYRAISEHVLGKRV